MGSNGAALSEAWEEALGAHQGELLELVAQSDLKITNTVGIWYMNLVTQAS